MKNKVDIGKLIEKKYKGNTLDLSDILEEIDLVLHESITNYEYRREQHPGYIEETDSGNARSIAYHNGAPIDPSNPAVGAPRQEIPGNLSREPQVQTQVLPYNISESDGALSAARQRTMTVPDLFSMITDPKKMSVGSPDRELINNIIANIGLQQTTSWREKIEKIQEHVFNLMVPSEQATDITQVISSLIFLNLFKKLSFFMDHPGKQFEYLFLPFLSPTAEVKGNESEEISDVVFDGKEYSLKFLTSKEPSVRGSYNNMMTKISQNRYSMNLVARVMPSGIIEFSEFGITSFHDLIVNNYKIIGDQSETSKFLWFESKVGGSEYPQFMCLIEADRQKLRDIEVGVEKTREKILGGSIGGKSFKETSFEKLKRDLTNFETDIKTQKQGSDKYNKAIENIKAMFPTFSQLVQDPNDKEQVLNYLGKEEGGIRKQIANAEQKIKVAKGLQPIVQKEAKIQKPQQQFGSGQIEIPIQGIWKTIVIKKLNLGNPEVYNKKLGFVAGQISNFYVDILNSLDELNKNITNYVATSSDTQRSSGSQTYAKNSVENAENIVKSINEIEGSKK